VVGPIGPRAARLVRDRLTGPVLVKAKAWLTDRALVKAKAWLTGPVLVKVKAWLTDRARQIGLVIKT
jgi:hypothetical protein